jgi:lipid-A-disaccharide synthase
MISCGEASGDLYAGALVRALRDLMPDLRVSGFGGRELERSGADLAGQYGGMTVTGLSEAVTVLRRSWTMLRELRAWAARTRPDVFVAIDFPDFNLRLLPAIHALGIPIVYYVSPQLWAWRSGRIAAIRKYVSRMLVIFPFELEIYERAGVPAQFVGHPLIELAAPTEPREVWMRSVGLDPARRLVGLLPGSRPSEVRHVLPGLAAAVPGIRRAHPDVQFAVPRAPSLPDEVFAPLRGIPDIVIREHVADDVLAAADMVVTASGTATVQAALHGTPMVIVYRLSPLTYALGKSVVKISTFGMVNLVAGRRIVPELIQDAFTPARVAAETNALLGDPARAAAMRADLAAVRTALGGPGASRRAAEAVRGTGLFSTESI